MQEITIKDGLRKRRTTVGEITGEQLRSRKRRAKERRWAKREKEEEDFILGRNESVKEHREYRLGRPRLVCSCL